MRTSVSGKLSVRQNETNILRELQEAVLRRKRGDRGLIVLGERLFEYVVSELRKGRSDIESHPDELNLWGGRLVLDAFGGKEWRATFSSRKDDFIDFSERTQNDTNP